MNSYDALVIGAGPAGSTAAIILSRAGWSVAVVEKTPFPRRKVCGEFISATSWPLLRELGASDALLAHAGPEIRRVGLYAGGTILSADMPSPWHGLKGEGRALGREHLDTLLLACAREAGAEVWQPWAVSGLEKSGEGYACAVVASNTREVRNLRARIIIAAHGSWEPGTMPTQIPGRPIRASDLLAFKAHFRHGSLPPDLMPLLVFPGGYGGLVQTDGGRVSLSCCIRRDVLEHCRRKLRHARAGQAVFAHLQASCRGVGEALQHATLDGTWLSTGPIRPGIRPFRCERMFTVGNAAGEAHPIVAEGISMAIQSSWLLCERLTLHKDGVFSEREVESAAVDYGTRWRANFARRIYASALFAQMAMRPITADMVVAFIKLAPRILTIGARLSGKAQPLTGLQIAHR